MPRKKQPVRPAAQPGADDLSKIGGFYMRWIRGEIDSIEAVLHIDAVVGSYSFQDCIRRQEDDI